MSEIDVQGALAALEEKGGMPEVVPSNGGDPFNRNGMGQFARAPEVTPATPAEPEAGTAPDAPAATPETGTATEGEAPFTHIDPANLPADLQTLYRGMQADYTRKTQEVAAWRKFAEESGVASPDELRPAIDTYQRLQDPSNWQAIHSELGQYMQSIGMTQREANAAASEAIAQFAPADEPDLSEWEGSELAPVLKQMQQLQQQNQALAARFEQDSQTRAQQEQFRQVAAHIDSQEQALRKSRPDYGEAEIEAIYSFMGDDANLVAAQQKYESVLAQSMQRVYAQKAGALAGTPTPLAGGGVITGGPGPEARPEGVDPMDWGHMQAQKAIRALDAAEAQL